MKLEPRIHDSRNGLDYVLTASVWKAVYHLG